ncbi:MAG: hypothetical protein KAS94_02305 [Desulfobulbaceae bacterium]|nr:hypothetical protein [Desulfobulbaceae bacterium]
MKKNLNNIEYEVKSKHQYMDRLNPEERRAAFISQRNMLSKNTNKKLAFLTIVGLLFSSLTVYIWIAKFQFSLLSNFGFIGGMIIAAFGFWYINFNRITANKPMLSNDFTDEDLSAYCREHEEVNKRALENWNKKGKYVVSIIGFLIIILIEFQDTMEFGSMVLASGLSIFLIGISGYGIFQFFINKLQDANRKSG